MADRHVSRAEIADRLHLSERQITTLVKSGQLADGTPFPSRVDGKRSRTFPVERCFDWYVHYKQEEALQRAGPKAPDNLADAELRKAIADAAIAELKLANLRNEVVPKEAYRAELRRILGKVRATVVSMPGRHASRVVGLDALPQAVLRLRAIADDLLSELQRAGDAEADDEGQPEALSA
jgi:phage terminase Nu1 subunit (DNA packaging protein)